ncbi:hypothetical protein PIB30_028335, partial [Stylosanthes scabra]|nr:hypothetical protein [Stylosanthes scabra]
LIELHGSHMGNPRAFHSPHIHRRPTILYQLTHQIAKLMDQKGLPPNWSMNLPCQIQATIKTERPKSHEPPVVVRDLDPHLDPLVQSELISHVGRTIQQGLCPLLTAQPRVTLLPYQQLWIPIFEPLNVQYRLILIQSRGGLQRLVSLGASSPRRCSLGSSSRLVLFSCNLTCFIIIA